MKYLTGLHNMNLKVKAERYSEKPGRLFIFWKFPDYPQAGPRAFGDKKTGNGNLSSMARGLGKKFRHSTTVTNFSDAGVPELVKGVRLNRRLLCRLANRLRHQSSWSKLSLAVTSYGSVKVTANPKLAFSSKDYLSRKEAKAFGREQKRNESPKKQILTASSQGLDEESQVVYSDTSIPMLFFCPTHRLEADIFITTASRSRILRQVFLAIYFILHFYCNIYIYILLIRK
eukprot:gene8009-5567_t